MQKVQRNKPGFVRVLITERNKTIQIRESHARNPKYLLKHGMVLIPEPIAPPISNMEAFQNYMTQNNPNALNEMADPESMHGGIPIDPSDANIPSKPIAKATKPKSQPNGK